MLSLSGNDTGSNFLPAAASNSVILKEEDGWEVFYSAAFRPWEHYIPLSEGAGDVAEKLAWARAHPEESAAMASASRAVFDALTAPENREAYLEAIAQDLNASAAP